MQKTSSSEKIKQTSHISENLYFIISVKHGKCEEKNQTIKLCINIGAKIVLLCIRMQLCILCWWSIN